MYSRSYPENTPEIPMRYFNETAEERVEDAEMGHDHQHEQKEVFLHTEHRDGKGRKSLFGQIHMEDLILGALLLMALSGSDEPCDRMMPVLLFILLAG